MEKVLVAGASGYLGHFVVKEFKKRNYRVRALARSAAKLENLKHYIDEEYIGQVTDPSSLGKLCHGSDIVFSAVGITRQRDNLTYMDVDYQGNMNLLEQAKLSGVSRFIYVSVLNAEKLMHLKMVAAKQAFVKELKQSGIEYTVIYPNGFFADMLEILKMAKKGRGYLIGDGNYRGNPIHGADLAEICADAVTSNEQEVHVGGPDILTQTEILELAFQALGSKSKIIHIPLWFRNVILSLIRTFTSQKIYGPVEFFLTVMAMDMVGTPYGKHRLKEFFEEKATLV
jgi:uncharacterized protein YbjT (DUF2867 family)